MIEGMAQALKTTEGPGKGKLGSSKVSAPKTPKKGSKINATVPRMSGTSSK